MSLPKFSIVTPSLNQSSFLEENIQSVLHQQYPSFEHIIIDGGSTDRTVEVIGRYSHLRSVSESDRGQAHALNKGFKLATGEIIGWLNADDYYLPGTLQTIAPLFDDDAVRVVYGCGYEVDVRGNRIREIIPRGISTEEFIRFWRWKYEYIQPSFFFRRSVFEEVGYLDESLYYTMDHDFFIRLSMRYPFTSVASHLSCYRLHGESKTGATLTKSIPPSIWELHSVSRRYWGTPLQIRYYSNLGSFILGILLSFFKNIFFLPGSKSRGVLTRSKSPRMSNHDG